MADGRTKQSVATTEFLASAVIGLGGVAMPMTAVLRCALLLVALAIAGHIVWKSEWTTRWPSAVKVLVVAIFGIGYGVFVYRLVFPPPTYIVLRVGKGLAENSAHAPREMIPRRAFVVEHHGPDSLHNVRVTVRDNRARNQLNNEPTNEYAEIDPETTPALDPHHFWVAPATPWEEDFTIVTTSRETDLIEHVRVGCSCSEVFFAIRVVSRADSRLLFSCRDSRFLDLPEWQDDPPQFCSSLMVPELLERRLTPRPFVIFTSPNKSIDMTPTVPDQPPGGLLVIGSAPACPATIHQWCGPEALAR